MEKRERIENRIRKGREEKGYRQSDVAFLLGHNCSSQVSCYERGQIMPDSENLLKLAYIFNTLPEGLYPEISRKWRQEVEKAREKLAQLKTNKTYEK
jgi:transcriptional regulator with XRE-family HTH domain